MKIKHLIWLVGVLTAINACKSPEIIKWDSTYSYADMDEASISAHIAVEKYLLLQYAGEVNEIPKFVPQVRIQEAYVDPNSESIRIIYNNRLAEYPIRPVTIAVMDSLIRENLPAKLRSHRLDFFSMGVSLQELIPTYYLDDPKLADYSRHPMPHQIEYKPLVLNLDRQWTAHGGLEGRHIALWHSHGWYYNQNLGRWKWQRPRLFHSVEDILPMTFTLPYIVPMLESAGAHVWLPRERDTQHHMVIIDNDENSNKGSYTESQTRSFATWNTGNNPGFGPFGDALKNDSNPFKLGTFRQSITDTVTSAQIRWTPEIPETGYYWVAVSYASSDTNTKDARYTVHHSGGKTQFSVDQTLGGGTWIYLGNFHFHAGTDENSGSVLLENRSTDPGKTLTADAVRFGGGVGISERGGRTSDRPRYLEAARYHLQFSGIPDTLVWKLNDNNDYSDDFQSRGEWVNYLRGEPLGPNRDRSAGMGIPVDLSLAFHTDAGVTRNDTVIGTLAIYSLPDKTNDIYFPNGVFRMANRDLTDIMQTQIVDDIRAKYDSTWVRRGLRNARYSEAMRPNVPSVLLELLSHQNFRDMEFAMDPQFRFDVSRSIYKSMVKFLGAYHGKPYVIQPLPVTHLNASITEYGAPGIKLRWKMQPDPLEPSADAGAYVVYIRTENGGFDNGRLVNDTSYIFHDAVPGKIYSFKVRAVNGGGAGFPSEIVSAMLPRPDSRNGEKPPVLIINGFTRVSAPVTVKQGKFHGFASFLDAGVPDRYEIGYTGEQYNFNLFDDWEENDRPGHGASHADLETTIIPGNTHDFAYIHGKAIRESGYSFVSTSLAAVEAGMVNPADYQIVNLILGNQRQTTRQTATSDSLNNVQFGIYSEGLRQFLVHIAANGGGILISGSHVGTDLIHRPLKDSTVVQFASQILGYEATTNHASRTGDVISVPPSFFQTIGSGARSSVNDGILASDSADLRTPPRNAAQSRERIRSLEFERLQFNTGFSGNVYRVDAPDAIKPSLAGSATILRYRENDFSAAVVYDGPYRTAILGFPFETILSEEIRTKTMQQLLKFLDNE